MKGTLTWLIAALTFQASAQSWAPIGATWTYDSEGFVLLQGGYSRMTYTNDTLLGGRSGQVIRSMSVGTPAGGELDTMFFSQPTITSSDDDIVWVWSITTETWDTLYNFGAVPGSGWQPPHATLDCGGPEYGDLVNVLDTGTVVVDDLSLHYLDVEVGFYAGRITERLGWTEQMYIIEGCWVDECDCGLRCYSDDEIFYERPGVEGGCRSIVGVDDPPLRSSNVLVIPGNNEVVVSSSAQPFIVEIRSISGALIAHTWSTNGEARLNVSACSVGTYLYAVRDTHGTSLARGVWVKP